MARRATKSSGKGGGGRGGKAGLFSTPKAVLTPASRVVVLAGKDAYLRGAYTEALRKALAAEHEGEPELIRFDGSSDALADVLDECRSFGLMAGHKLVVVEQADDLAKGEHRALLQRYAEAPSEGATLVLRCDSWNRGKNLDEAITAVGGFIACDAPSESDLLAAAQNRARRDFGVEIDDQTAAMLLDRVGRDAGRVAMEVDKLAMAALAGVGGSDPAQPRVTAEAVRAMVGVTREEQAWAVQGAVLSGDPRRALEAIDELLTVSRAPDVLVRWALADLARKIHVAAHGGKLFGPGAREAAGAARRMRPGVAARLLKLAADTDANAKSGVGDARRGLEALAVSFAAAIRGESIEAGAG